MPAVPAPDAPSAASAGPIASTAPTGPTGPATVSVPEEGGPAQWQVFAVRYGTLHFSKKVAYHHYFVYHEPDEDLEMAYYFWVLRRGSETVVVDTGFDPEVGARRQRTCLRPPLQCLSLLGIDPGSVAVLVLTHLHYDHIGNVGGFSGARVVVGREELRFWRSAIAAKLHFAHAVEAPEVSALDAIEAEGRLQVVGDGEVVPGIALQWVGGHTPGQAIVRVQTASGLVVLASDAMHFYEELELDRPYAVHADLVEMYQAFATLRQLRQEEGAVLIAGHDPLVFDRYPSVPGPAAAVAVQVA